MSLLLKYLGLSLGASYMAKHIREDMIEKIERWLASWKMPYLSKIVGLPLSRVPYPTYLRTSCPYFLSM